MDWRALRAEMPVTRQWVYLDHAAVAPIITRALAALTEWGNDLANNGAVHHGEWKKRAENTRGLAGRLLNADPLDIAFVKNTSEGVGIVAEGLPWQPGDNVVTAAEEYPANIYPWLNLAQRGVEVRRVASRDNRILIDDIRDAVNARTRLVTVSHVEFSSGFRNDLYSLGELCRSHGVYFFVDAIQGLGVFPIDVDSTPIDFLAADGHKWLLGPEGAGVFFIRRELVDELHPIDIGWNSVVNNLEFSQIDFTLKPHAGRWESGTLNFGGIAALGASLDLLLSIGICQIENRVVHLTDYLCNRAERSGLAVFSSRSAKEKSGIVALNSPADDPRSVVRALRQSGIVINSRAGKIRVSPHCYNTEEEIDRLIEELAMIRKTQTSFLKSS